MEDPTKASAPQKLPPGMVMGPDGKPCRACNESALFKKWKPPKAPKKEAAIAATAATAVALTDADRCPPDVELLGRSTWMFLHTAAAYYPESPSPAHQKHMSSLLQSLPSLYPCSHCATHLGENLKSNPPDVSGRGPLSRWLCARHNDVNERLGKPMFDCSKTDERWKDGPKDGSCD